MVEQLLIMGVVSFFAIMSGVLVHEKKERQRAGLSDYYDNPIPKNKCVWDLENEG